MSKKIQYAVFDSSGCEGNIHNTLGDAREDAKEIIDEDDARVVIYEIKEAYIIESFLETRFKETKVK